MHALWMMMMRMFSSEMMFGMEMKWALVRELKTRFSQKPRPQV